LADGENEAAVLVQEGWGPGKLEGVIFEAQEAEEFVGEAKSKGTPAGAVGVE
jgi:hypothetical protein